MFNYTENFCLERNESFSNYDTVIILSRGEQDIKKHGIVQKLIARLDKLHKKVICIDVFGNYYKPKYRYRKIKVWYPSNIKYFYNNYLLHKEIDIPLIAVYDYTDNCNISILRKLNVNFGNEGYYAVGICADPLGILAGLDYLPVEKDEKAEGIKRKLEALHRVYKCDILLFGFKANTTSVKEFDNAIKPDISIFVVDNYINEIEKVTYERDNCGTIIIANPKFTEKYMLFCSKVFDDDNFDLMYKYIYNMLT